MLDPFLPPFPTLAALTVPIARHLDLPTLPYHIHEVIFAFVLYQFTQSVLSPLLSRSLFPSIYPALPRRTQLNWDVHVVSLVQSCLINALALWVIWTDGERRSMDAQERVFGYTGSCGLIQGLATGYFLWDLVVSTIHLSVFGIGFWAHAASALWVFSFGFRPFLNYYGPTFILYELSSPFLNIHWFLDKLQMTGSNLQWYNGMLLLGSFFSARLVWGTYQSLRVYQDVWSAFQTGPMNVTESLNKRLANGAVLGALRTGNPDIVKANEEVLLFSQGNIVPLWLAITYLSSNIILNGLNFYWFGRMIETVMKRFRPAPEETKAGGPKRRRDSIVVEGVDVDVDGFGTDADGMVLESSDVDLKRGLDDNGTKSVGVEKKEVRRRRA